MEKKYAKILGLCRELQKMQNPTFSHNLYGPSYYIIYTYQNKYKNRENKELNLNKKERKNIRRGLILYLVNFSLFEKEKLC